MFQALCLITVTLKGESFGPEFPAVTHFIYNENNEVLRAVKTAL